MEETASARNEQSQITQSLNHKSIWLPWLLVVGLVLMWGTSFILIKRGLAAYRPVELGALRIVLAAAVLVPFGVRGMRLVPRARWRWLLTAGVLGNFLPAILFAWAETRLASGLAGILNSLTGLFTLLAGAALFGQRLTRARLAGVVLGMTGTAILLSSGPGGLGRVVPADVPYGLLIVVATAMYGLNLNLIKYRLAGIPPVEMAALALLFVAGPAALVLTFTDVVAHTTAPGGGVALGAVAILAVGSTALGLVLYNWLIQLRGTVFATTTTYLMPVVSLAWGVLDGERIYAGHYAGLAVILVGVALVSRAK
ncbi:MAG: EamA family transporter [Hymenobacteraceae bacterium]|nr:EamA family transporter [Hymenobacteraceae bacterium]